MKRGSSIGDVFADGARWTCLLTVLVLLTIPLWGGLFVSILRFVLEGLNSIGQS